MPVQWRIVDVTPGSGPNGTGGFGPGKTISYQLASGHTGQVFVPDGSFDMDTVRAKVIAEAAKLNDVLNLSSDTSIR